MADRNLLAQCELILIPRTERERCLVLQRTPHNGKCGAEVALDRSERIVVPWRRELYAPTASDWIDLWLFIGTTPLQP
jgi:hypothetical protein